MFTELLVKRKFYTAKKIQFFERELIGKKGKEANKIAILYMYKYTIFFFSQKGVDGGKKAKKQTKLLFLICINL